VKRTSLADHPCSIARALDAAGEWWTPLILRDVAYGVRRFGDLQEDLGISANVLADRLEALLAEGILDRRAYQALPRRSEYHLTQKGAELLPALLALMQWGDRWSWSDGGGPVRVIHEECGEPVRVELRCEHCERAVQPRELRATLSGKLSKPPREGEPGSVSGHRLYAASGGAPLAS
jgi:DNA-binding HxlR family transcriptional regulator